MAPEQISGEPPNTKSDVYSLASVLYEILTGRRLFVGEPNAIIKRKLLEDTPPLDDLPSGPLREQFEGLLTWALARKAPYRPSAIDFARSLIQLQPEIVNPSMKSSATFIDLELLSQTPAPDLLSKRSKATASTSQVLQAEQSESDILATTTRFKSRSSVLVAVALGFLVVLILLYLQANKETPSAKPLQIEQTIRQPSSSRRIEPTKINTVPSGARLYDKKSGKLLGTTPYSLSLHPKEKKSIRVAKRGFKTATIHIRYGQNPVALRLSRKTTHKNPDLAQPATVVHPKQVEPPPSQPPNHKEDGLLEKREIPSWN